MGGRTALALIAVTCGGLMLAAPASAVEYFGTIAPGPGNEPDTELLMQVVMTKETETQKRRPIAISRFEPWRLRMACAEGNTIAPPRLPYPDEIPVRRRTFAASDVQSDRSYEVSGRIPRKGPARGTLRITLPHPVTGSPCDSGVVSWSTKKRQPAAGES